MKKEKAQALVEFALLLPIFILIVFLTIQFGIILNAYVSITHLSREGARYAAINYNKTDDEIRNYIRGNPEENYSGGINPSHMYGGDFTNISIYPPYGSPLRKRGFTITVTIVYNLKGTKPKLFLPTTFLGVSIPTTISSQTSMRIE
jgi:hypothetical protein